MNNNHILIIMLVGILAISSIVAAVPLITQGDIYLMDIYGIANATYLYLHGPMTTNSTITSTNNISASWIDADTESSNVKNPPSACTLYSAVTGFNTNFSASTCMDAWIHRDGDTMTGDLNHGGNDNININYTETDYLSGSTWTGTMDANGEKLENADLSGSLNLSDNNLTARWNFDETIGNVVFSSGKTSLNGRISNAIRTDGKYDKGIYFDGDNDAIEVEHNNVLNITEEITLMIWMKVPENGTYADGQYIITKDGKWSLWTRPYQFITWRLVTETTGYQADNYNINFTKYPNKWYHITATYDMNGGINNKKIYINGALVGSYTQEGYINQTINNLYLGGASLTTSEFFGTLDNIEIYDRALTASEIRTRYSTFIFDNNGDIFSGTKDRYHIIGTKDIALYTNGTVSGCEFWNETGRHIYTPPESDTYCN